MPTTWPVRYVCFCFSWGEIPSCFPKPLLCAVGSTPGQAGPAGPSPDGFDPHSLQVKYKADLKKLHKPVTDMKESLLMNHVLSTSQLASAVSSG